MGMTGLPAEPPRDIEPAPEVEDTAEKSDASQPPAKRRKRGGEGPEPRISRPQVTLKSMWGTKNEAGGSEAGNDEPIVIGSSDTASDDSDLAAAGQPRTKEVHPFFQAGARRATKLKPQGAPPVTKASSNASTSSEATVISLDDRPDDASPHVPDMFLTQQQRRARRKQQIKAKESQALVALRESKEASKRLAQEMNASLGRAPATDVAAVLKAAALASSMARREEGALDGEVVVRAGSFQECPAPWPRAQHIGVAPYPHTDIFKDRTAWLPRNTRPAPDTATLPAWPAGTKPATECDRSEPGPGPLGIMVEEYLGEVAMVTGVGRGRVGDLHALCQAARDAGDGTELWVHKYRPTAAHAVLGNGDHAGLIVQWLREWGTRPQSSPSPSPAKRRRGRAQIVIETDEGSDSDFAPRVRVRRGGGDSSDDEYLAARRDQYRGACEGRSIMVVTGPPGCGKSAAVYACAEELGHTVIEIHAGMRRAGRCVTDMLSEATQSRRVGGWATQAVDAEGCIVVDDGSEVTPGETASVILVEDIDVLFADEDRGFWGALTQVAESTKRPIVFTSNQPDPFIPPTLRYFHHAFRNPPHRETAALACVISLCEGRPLPPLDVLAMVEALSGDLRQTIATLQFTCLAAPARVLAHVMGIDPHNGPTNRRELVDTLRQKDGRRPLAQVCNTLEALARGGHDIAWNAMYGALVAPAPFGEPATGSPSHAAVSAIAGFLDSMSQADAYIRITSYMGDMPGEWRGVDGVVTDDVGAVDEEEQYMQGAGLHESEVRVHTDAEIRSCLDALAFQAFVQAPSTYPADTMAPDTFCVFARADPRAGAWPAQHLAVEEVVPAAAKIWRRNVAMDYLPALRGMHEAELVRQAQNTKRRFQHYFKRFTFPRNSYDRLASRLMPHPNIKTTDMTC